MRSHPALLAILLAFPAAMALATGVEAPSTAIAQLGQLADEGRKRFGLLALLATLVIVGTLTLGFTALAVRLDVVLPIGESTLTVFYAVSVFLSLLAGLVSITVFAYREGERRSLAVNAAGALVVAFVLVMNLARVAPLASVGAILLIALGLYELWVRNGRPRGIAGTKE